ncbi:MAG: hypothetical protein R3321_12995, partial [Nitrososphaeraceae archaeon]|nr:hypothetical protein [Nitrososphaeraceae archaeon]
MAIEIEHNQKIVIIGLFFFVSLFITPFLFEQEVFAQAFDPPVTLDSAGDVGQYTSITIGTDGFPVISYEDVSNGDLKFVHCTSVDCSTFDPPIVINPVGGSTAAGPLQTGLAVGSDGFPIISHYNRQTNILNVIHCTSIDCSTTDPVITPDLA